MPYTYDWATDETTINANITVDLVYPVTTAFSVITTVVQAPEKGSVGIKVTDGANSLYFVSGPMTGVNVIPLPRGIAYMAMEWSNTDKVFYPYTSVDGIVWDLWPMLADENGVPAPYPTFNAPTHAGVCFIADDPLLNEVVVLGSPRVFTSLLFAGDDDFYVIPFAEEELKPIGAVPPTQPDPVTPSAEAIIHGLVGAPFGDLEFDVGKSVGWLQRFVDDIFVTDVNRGDQRYWVVNWTKTFAYTYYKFSPLNYFTDPEAYRKGQWTDATSYASSYPDQLVYDDNDWVIFLDAHEGLSADNRSFPDDILIEPYKSFIYREIARANAAGADRIVLPFFVFLRHDHIQNVSQSYTFEDTTFTSTQSVGVPYYVPYNGLTRMFKVSVLRDPDFDWSIIDTPVPIPAAQAPEPPYLVPTTGTVTTPDPGPLPGECVVVCKVRGPKVGGASNAIAGQFELANTRSWVIRRDLAGPGGFILSTSPDGAAIVNLSANSQTVSSSPELLALSVRLANRQLTTWRSLDNGATFQQLAQSAPGAAITLFDTSLPVRIGASNYMGTWDDRIYSVELRTGLNPSVGGAQWTPGYITFPTTTAMNAAVVNDVGALPADASGSMRVECDRAAPDGFVHAPIGGQYFLLYLPYLDGNIYFYFYDTTPTAVGVVAIPADMTAAGVPATGRWQFKVTWNAATDMLSLHGRDPALGRDLMDDTAGWTLVKQAVQAGKQLRTTTAAQYLHSYDSSWRGNGRIWRAVMEINGTVKLDIDFRYLNANPGTSMVLPTGQTMTLSKGGTPPMVGTPKVDGVVWKFDANEYPGTGTSYVDPRGRTWTLTNAAAITPYKPNDVKLQVVSYAYAHWNLPEVPPGQTTVPPLDADNDDGWKQRCIMSQAVSVPGLPVGSASDPVGTWIAPTADPPGLRGPWAPENYVLKITDPVIPAPPPPVVREVEAVRVPMYDLVFRLNVRDGVWYTSDGLGPVEVVWDEDAEEFVPYIPA